MNHSFFFLINYIFFLSSPRQIEWYIEKIKILKNIFKMNNFWDPSDPIGPNIDQNLNLQFLSEIFFKIFFFLERKKNVWIIRWYFFAFQIFSNTYRNFHLKMMKKIIFEKKKNAKKKIFIWIFLSQIFFFWNFFFIFIKKIL